MYFYPPAVVHRHELSSPCSSCSTWSTAPSPARGNAVSAFGGVLDSSCDRIADAAIFGRTAWYFARHGQQWMLLAALLCLVLGALTSYIRARAEAAGFNATVGIAERAERLIIVLVGTGLTGLAVPRALHAGGRAVAAGRRVDRHGGPALRHRVPAVSRRPTTATRPTTMRAARRVR